MAAYPEEDLRSSSSEALPSLVGTEQNHRHLHFIFGRAENAASGFGWYAKAAVYWMRYHARSKHSWKK
jgi:hypothetical protein